MSKPNKLVIGKLTILREIKNALVIERDISGKCRRFVSGFLCQCECGNQVLVYNSNLIKENLITSCGCIPRDKKKERAEYLDLELRGKKFGKLTIVKYIPDAIKSGVTSKGKSRTIGGFKCKCDCGTTKIIRTQSILNGTSLSCGCLKRSKGETKIYNYLKSKKIKFETEKTFTDLRFPGGGIPRFDFYIKSLNLIIEFDGEHHFKPIRKSRKAKAYFLKVKINDSIKDKYCIEHNLRILRIPYWDMNTIETILDKELKI
ncbi:MAG: hypothetical protein ACRCX2_16110 [Paraclostridium sp.]